MSQQIICHIIGQPGSGKTTLVAALVRHFTAQGMAVGTIKHSAHDHELDKPGKDSHIHRTAGAAPAGMVTGKMAALYFPNSDLTRPDRLIKTYYTHADIILIEGWISGPYPKIEIWRNAVGRPPLFPDISTVKAMVTDDPFDSLGPRPLDILRLNNLSTISNYILNTMVDHGPYRDIL
ncbi:MAG: molybdopterin-guanine dinucleotide biosynthesis protein B [Desulfobacterales bacterium]|nr:MAG: molybdopterin-guanine dinucleotide biosynthesis protein B [Desulfobacterales bacterium]